VTEPSETPLVRKLGIRPGARVAALCPPAGFTELLGDLPPDARLVRWPQRHSDVIVVFATAFADLDSRFAEALPALAVDGGLWICYPKRASGVVTDLTFDKVQHLGLAAGLVDNKGAAIDATWSGLRFVVPLASRPTWAAAHVSASRRGRRGAIGDRQPSSAPRDDPRRRR
jgi:hypothetical protein